MKGICGRIRKGVISEILKIKYKIYKKKPWSIKLLMS